MNDDRIFKALADASRRYLLDLLFARYGQTLTELESKLQMTRFGVMKHLRVLEAAGLVCFVDAGVITTLKPALDDDALAELSYGGTVLELDADLDARSQSGGVRAVAWDPAGQALAEATAVATSQSKAESATVWNAACRNGT